MSFISCNEEVCIGCRLCEIWCLVAHSKSKDIIKAFLYEKDRAMAKVHVEERGPVSFALHCRHCEDAHCIYACISGALYKSAESGIVLHDAPKCVGCWSCVLACPNGAIIRDFASSKVLKCDLCVENDEPVCVKKCPNNALKVEQEAWTANI